MAHRTEYKGYVIQDPDIRGNPVSIYKGTLENFVGGDKPPQWITFADKVTTAKKLIDESLAFDPLAIVPASRPTVPTRKTKLWVLPNSMPMEARLVTVDNLEEVARWCGGQVKGTSLPPEQRIVGWYDQGWSYGDIEARVGDWIVKWGMGYSSYDQKTFEANFHAHDSEKK